MFDPQQLQVLLELHEKSFALLRWIRAALKTGQISFSVVHQNTDSATAAIEWINRHFQNLPHDVRPQQDQVPTFARLFVAFLTTSFQLKPSSVRLVSDCGCYCSWCAYLQAGPQLVPRSPSKKDQLTAHELKQIYLQRLAEEHGSRDSREVAQRLLGTPDLAESIAIATWGAELIRRSQFVSQGEAVLALWRQFAWREGKAHAKFRLTAKALLAAEKQIVAAL